MSVTIKEAVEAYVLSKKKYSKINHETLANLLIGDEENLKKISPEKDFAY